MCNPRMASLFASIAALMASVGGFVVTYRLSHAPPSLFQSCEVQPAETWRLVWHRPDPAAGVTWIDTIDPDGRLHTMDPKRQGCVYVWIDLNWPCIIEP